MRRAEQPGGWEDAELDLAMAVGECPVCVLAAETEEASLFWLVKANSNDPDTVGAVVRGGGLCRLHWQGFLALRGGDPGFAGIQLLELTAEAIVRGRRERATRGPRCFACRAIHARENATVELLLGRLVTDAGRAEFDASFGFCEEHLTAALEHPESRSLRAELLRIQNGQLERLRERLSQCRENHDARILVATAIVAKLTGSRGPSVAPGRNN